MTAPLKLPLYVLKIGGKILETTELLDSTLDDFLRLEGNKLLVHGGGKTGTQIADRLGVKSIFKEGRRITNTPMLEVALMVYGGLMNKGLVSQLQSKGANALGLTGADLNLIRSVKRPVKEIDYGWVGDIVEVNGDQLHQLLEQNILPVIAPLTHDGKGQMLNTNADTIASRLSQRMVDTFEVHLIYCFEKSGVLLHPEDEQSLIPHLNLDYFNRLHASGTIAGGMIPKLENAFHALKKGVRQVYICHSEAVAHIGTDQFRGTIISID